MWAFPKGRNEETVTSVRADPFSVSAHGTTATGSRAGGRSLIGSAIEVCHKTSRNRVFRECSGLNLAPTLASTVTIGGRADQERTSS